MEEYEVELIDYLRVIWKGKWIILACLIVAVAFAAAVSFTRPNNYETEGTYKLSSLPQLDSIIISMLSKVDALAILRSRDLMQEVVASDKFPREGWPEDAREEDIANWLVDHIHAENPEGDLLRVSIAGFKPPYWLRDVLSQIVEEFEQEIRQRTIHETEQEETWLEANVQLLSRRQREVEEEISKEAGLLEGEYQRQIEPLQERMRAIEQESPADLLVGENNATLQGYIMRERYRGLVEQLLPLQTQLDNLHVNKRNFFPQRYSELDSLDLRIQEAEEKLARLAQFKLVFSTDPLALVSFETPYASESPTGGSRNLNITVAAVLGLFVGILVAFFFHYLVSVREKEREKGRAKS